MCFRQLTTSLAFINEYSTLISILYSINIDSFSDPYTVGMPCTCIGVGRWIFILFKALMIARGNFISCKNQGSLCVNGISC